MRRLTLIACLVILLLARMGEPLVAQEAGPTMRVIVGFDSYCRRGDWCPIYAVLSNEGADVEGELHITVGGGRGTDSDLYARRVVLPAHSRKAYTLYLPPAGLAVRSHLTVQLLAGDKALSSEQVAVMWLDEEDRLYGVASSSPSALNFLSDVAPAGGRARVAHLDLEVLPPDPLGWEGLDVLILSDVDTTVLSSERRQALETWVVHGGHLIVGGGAGAARTVAGVADLLPVTVGGTRSVDDLRVLGEQADAPVAAGPYAVAEAALRDGEVLVEQDDLILLARRTYGAGKVDFLAFDPDLNPFTRWDDNVELWEFIVEAASATTQRFAVQNGYSARDAINAIPGLEIPSALHLLAFMLVYTLLIGPVNYVILRKLDRRELAWLTIPALILGFTVCAYVTGFQIRGSTAIAHWLAVVYVPQESRVGRVSQMVGLFSPRRTTYDVWVAGAGVREIPDDYYGGPARRPLRIVEESEGSTVTDLRVDVGGIRPFVAEGYADVPGVEADLRLVGDGTGVLRLEGTVRNGAMPLEDVVLIVGDDGQRLGNLDAGEEASVRLRVHSIHSVGGVTGPAPYSVFYPGYNISEQILGPGNYGEDRKSYRRYQFLQALFPYDSPGLGSGVYLVGWAEEQTPLPVEVVDRPFSTVGTALYVYDLPVVGLEAGSTVTIPPGLIERQVVETTGYVDMWPQGFHMAAETKIVFRFTTWSPVAVHQVDELVLDIQGSGYSSTSRPLTISLWNWESDDWEQLDIGWGQYSIPNAEAYVLPPGDVLVCLETSDEWPADVESLTITIKGQR